MRPLKRASAKEAYRWTEVPPGARLIKNVLEFVDYRDAVPALTKNFGPFCSYCEAPIAGIMEVEHKKPKTSHLSLAKNWTNLLLSCRSCNGYKSNKNITWFPDELHFWRYFKYEVATSETELLITLNPGTLKLPSARKDAEGLVRDLHINNRPGHEQSKEKFVASGSSTPRRRKLVADLAQSLLDQDADFGLITRTAYMTGFWTVWFYSYLSYYKYSPDKIVELILALTDPGYFPGTNLHALMDWVELVSEAEMSKLVRNDLENHFGSYLDELTLTSDEGVPEVTQLRKPRGKELRPSIGQTVDGRSFFVHSPIKRRVSLGQYLHGGARDSSDDESSEL